MAGPVWCRFLHVYEAYTISLNTGVLTYAAFGMAIQAIQEMWVEYAVVFCLAFFWITRCALRLSHRVSKDAFPVFSMPCAQFFMVCMVVPAITLFATFLHNGFSSQWFVQWVELAAKCFPMALCLQIVLVGPVVGFCFRSISMREPAMGKAASAEMED